MCFMRIRVPSLTKIQCVHAGRHIVDNVECKFTENVPNSRPGPGPGFTHSPTLSDSATVSVTVTESVTVRQSLSSQTHCACHLCLGIPNPTARAVA